ncbi:hypothetical protein JM16_002211 [Phytophthora kernoviae]|uniref:Uncharacterized protein n=1 Tax=Phytophthora kernoviae TaxID=325452 RepID=A0A8T0LXG0_9STRA|nr:hypothetical protein JM16_002211 [Phytophthora kernoviae]
MNITKIIAHLALIAAAMGSLSEAGHTQTQTQQGVSADDSYTSKTPALTTLTLTVTHAPTTPCDIGGSAHGGVSGGVSGGVNGGANGGISAGGDVSG